MIIGVPKETWPGERRVALIPASLAPLTKAGHEILVETGAGAESGFSDDDYTAAGAKIAPKRADVFSSADVIVQVRAAGANKSRAAADQVLLKKGQKLIAQMDPLGEAEQIRTLSKKGVTAFALELIPRITRAQSMDVLSSMATVAGYKAVLMAADTLPKMFPLLMTAAGTVKPARVLIIGAGVAGLQAIATAKRLGAVVEAYDVRPVVKEQVESLGAKFVELEIEAAGSEDKGGYAKEMGEEFYRKQREAMAKVVAEQDVIITTALIPGRDAPVLVTDDMVKGMRAGSVIIDLAAERGGNVEPSQPDKTVVAHGVTVLGPTNLPSTIPAHASQLYAKNVTTFLAHLIDKEGNWKLDPKDEIVRDTMVCHEGDVPQARLRDILKLPPLDPPKEKEEKPAADETKQKPDGKKDGEAKPESKEKKS